MTQPTLPTGTRIVGAVRKGACGWWWRGQAPEGADVALLRIEEPADPAAAQRLAAGVRAVAAQRHGGLLTTAEPVRHDGALWLVTAEPAIPTLADVAASGGGLDAGSVATVAAEIAQTLTALHAAGLGHGAVQPRTVVITAIGAITLAEAALLPALRGVPADPGGDRRAWADLVRWMVNRWCPPGPTTDLMRHCARLGEHDLPRAVRELRDHPAVLASGFGNRSGLLAAVAAYQRWSQTSDEQTIAVPASPADQAPTQTVRYDDGATTQAVRYDDAATEAIPADVSSAGADRTELLSAGGDAATVAIPAGDATQALATPALPADEPTMFGPASHQSTGARPVIPAQPPAGVDPWGTATVGTVLPEPTTDAAPRPVPPAPAGEVRFGPGVPGTPPTAPTWQRPAPPPPRPRRSPWRRIGSILSALLTIALLAVVGLHLWQRLSPLEIRSVQVAVPDPPGDRCDVTVDVVATVQTNGRAGSITYQWLREGAEPGGVLTEQVGRGQQTVTLRLRWAFSGVGSTTATAVVNITDPAPVQGRTSFRYQCRG